MANSELYGKTYSVPSDVSKYIQTVLVSNPTGEGVKRAKFIVKNGILTYQELKGLKHFFDIYNPQMGNQAQYALAGGDLMKAFIDRTLQAERNAVKTGKQVKQDMNVDVNLGTQPYQTPRLNETGVEHMVRTIDREILIGIINEEKKKEDLKKNAVAIIVNDNNKFLLLKRSDDPKIWQPSKWALVGGGIEKGESPQQAVEREILEEIGIEIKKFIKTFSIQRHTDSIEHIFACRYDGEPTDIKLNVENTNYGWFDTEEMNYLDIVPHLLEYITLAFKNYDE
jgi:8-oxo-dGTP diphosphatase